MNGLLSNAVRLPSSQRGISLLEVLAALVILSMGATVSFTWFGQSVATMNRLKQEEKLLLVQTEAIEHLRAINPAVQPQGSVVMEGYALAWSSRMIRPLQRSLNKQGGNGRYEVGLYEVSAQLNPAGKSSEALAFKVELAGYTEIAGSGLSW